MANSTVTLEGFPPQQSASAKDYDKLAREFVKALSAGPDSTWTKDIGTKQDRLEKLNPEVYSISYLFVLNAQCNTVGKDSNRLASCINRAIIFFATFDPVQIRYAGTQFRTLLEWTLESISQSNSPDFSPIVAAILRLDPSGGTFTSNHLLLIRHCLASGVPSQVLPLLDRDIYAFPQKAGKNQAEENLVEEQELSNSYITAESGFSLPLKSEFVMEYYLLGAHIYVGMRKYNRARLFLEYILLTPSPHHSHSALQIEAYKRWVLVGLLADGVRFHLPRTHDQQVMKSVRAASKAYETLAEDFEKRDWRKFLAEVDVGQEIWEEDGNMRLVKETVDALLNYRISDLQKTYAAVPVSRVAAHLSIPPQEALRLLTDLIHSASLNASLVPTSNGSASDAVLRFHSLASSSSNPPSDLNDLEGQAGRIQNLVGYVRDANRRLQLTKEYVDYQKRQKRSGAGPEGDLADQMDLTWDAPIIGLNDEDGDEDLMG